MWGSGFARSSGKRVICCVTTVPSGLNQAARPHDLSRLQAGDSRFQQLEFAPMTIKTKHPV